MKSIIRMLILLCAFGQTGFAQSTSTENETVQDAAPPTYLYKILSIGDWEASQHQEHIRLPASDTDFIHFSREDQLERIITKYWSKSPQFVVLKVKTEALPGKLVFEANPGGTSKYYHLYNGSIPLTAVVEANYRTPTEKESFIRIRY